MFRPAVPAAYTAAGPDRFARFKKNKVYKYATKTYEQIQKSDDGNVWIVALRAVLFVLYFGLSITALVYAFKSGGSCMVRQTYTPTSMDLFGGSSMYTSMGVISSPPPSRVGAMLAPAPEYTPHMADLAAFPTMISHATRDAAFVMVHRAPGSPPTGLHATSFVHGPYEDAENAFGGAVDAEQRLASALARRNITGVESDGAAVPNLAR
jgi:hypothetical protein